MAPRKGQGGKKGKQPAKKVPTKRLAVTISSFEDKDEIFDRRVGG